MIKRPLHVALALAAFAAVPVQAVQAPPLDGSVLQNVSSATVLVLTSSGSGSGFVIATERDRLLIVTNDHVVRSPSGETSREVQVVFRSGTEVATQLPAALIGTDREADLALLSVHAPRPSPAPLALASECRLDEGLPIYVIGFPFGTLLGADGLLPAPGVNPGLASAGRATVAEARGLLQVEAGINPGNSGGPVVDAAGTVLGAAVAHFRGTEASFAIPCESIVALLRRLAPDARHASRAVAKRTTRSSPPAGSQGFTTELLRRSLALVRADGELACGFVSGRRGGELLILTNHHSLHDAAGRRRTRVEVAFPGQPSQPATILRSDPETDVALLATANYAEAKPVTIANARRLRETARVRIAGFRPEDLAGPAAARAVPEIQEASVVSLRRGRGNQLIAVQVDAGINEGNTGGPVLDEKDSVVGIAVLRATGTNVSLVVPGEALRDLLRGGLRGGAGKWAHDGKNTCVFEIYVEVDDPLRQLESVGLVVEDISVQMLVPGGTRTVAPLGPVRAEAPLGESGSATLSAIVTPCPAREPPRYQIVTSDARREMQVSLPYEIGPGSKGSGYHGWTFRGTYQSGDLAVQPAGFLSTPPRAPGWSTACLGSDLAPCQRACESGDPSSCVRLADRLTGARSEHAGKRQAARHYRFGCDAGIAAGCHGLALLMSDKVVEGTESERIGLEGKACDAGIARACDVTGVAFRDGLGVTHDEERGAKFFRKACELSDGLGCRLLAEVTYGGRGVARSLEYSAWLYQKGCSLSDSGSCYGLGLAHAEGAGVPQSWPKAAELYGVACEAGYGDACNNLAAILARGTGGVQRDQRRAAELFRKACQTGSKAGCQNAR